MSRRRLSPEDRELWDRVRRSAVPLTPPRDPPIGPPPSVAAPSATPPSLPAVAPLAPFRLGERADVRRPHDLAPGWADGLGRAPLRMDAGAFGRMARGKLRPEARLDLHGLTLAEAYPTLVGWILESRARGRRLVLVITGKGREAPSGHERLGRLRRDVPRWLALPPLSAAVLQVAPAHRRHGGDGALYVYLRAP